MISRRNLLQYFGIGTAIVPVVGGVPRLETPATLIQVPEVEPVKLATAMDLVDPSMLVAKLPHEKVTIDVFLRTERKTYHFNAETFLTHGEAQLVDITTCDDKKRRFLPVPAEARWTLSGVIAGWPTTRVIDVTTHER